ncbi:MAG: UbiD family decarboxylase [Anaerolineae bacterium]|nr:UbiD family decarboxylase [Anaerolineae bacterium]
MQLRDFLTTLETTAELRRISKPVSPQFEAASIIAHYDGKPLLFDNLPQYPGWQLASGYIAQRAHFAAALGCDVNALVKVMASALNNPSQPPLVTEAPCQEVEETQVDLDKIPIPRYHPLDGGPYITAGVSVIADPDLGRNISFHRLMRISKDSFVGRIVENRGTHTAWLKSPKGLPMAVCIGLPPQILLAAAMSPPKGIDELSMAHTMAPISTVKAKTVPLEIPAESELVLEGILTHEMTAEGPFPDLTGTMDGIREQPIFRVTAITHRRDPIFHALLPAGTEHKNLMGMPREPTIYAAVNKVARCTGVIITPGGCSWLHAVIQIDPQGPDDARRAIQAAFKGHASLKHVVIVDPDINILDAADVEWAIATRFQASHDLVLMNNQPSSSLDPSARHIAGQKAQTSKMGLDATIPWGESRLGYIRVSYTNN